MAAPADVLVEQYWPHILAISPYIQFASSDTGWDLLIRILPMTPEDEITTIYSRAHALIDDVFPTMLVSVQVVYDFFVDDVCTVM